MSVAKCHKESWLARSRCIMWFKALSWQGLFSSLTLSVKNRAESREKKTCSWFTMKPKRVFVLALRNTIVTALHHLQWKVITPTLSSKQFSLRKKNRFVSRFTAPFHLENVTAFTFTAGGSFCGIFMGEHYIHFQTSCFWIKYNYVHRLNQSQPHRKRWMYN